MYVRDNVVWDEVLDCESGFIFEEGDLGVVCMVIVGVKRWGIIVICFFSLDFIIIWNCDMGVVV